MDTYQISRSDRMKAILRTHSQKLRIKLFKRPGLRFSLSGGLSIGIHAIIFVFFFVLTKYGSPDVLEIRNIDFVDLSDDFRNNPFAPEETIVASEAIINQVVSNTLGVDAPNATDAPRSSVKPEKSGQPHKKGRKQIPINLANMAPLVLDAPKSDDVLHVFPSNGLKTLEKGNKVPRGLDLNSKSFMKLVADKKPDFLAPDANIPHSGIVLASKTTDVKNQNEQVLAGPALLTENSIRVEKNLDGAKPQKLVNNLSKSKMFITGPLASRGILYKIIPTFPRSAKRQGIGATISLRFTVMETGKVKENVIVVRTSGLKDWDDQVIDTLQKWRFKPLPVLGRKDQSGVITFQFVLE